VTPIVTRNFDIKNALFGKFARDSLGRDPRFEQKKLSDNSPGNIGWCSVMKVYENLKSWIDLESFHRENAMAARTGVEVNFTTS